MVVRQKNQQDLKKDNKENNKDKKGRCKQHRCWKGETIIKIKEKDGQDKEKEIKNIRIGDVVQTKKEEEL